MAEVTEAVKKWQSFALSFLKLTDTPLQRQIDVRDSASVLTPDSGHPFQEVEPGNVVQFQKHRTPQRMDLSCAFCC